MVKLILAVACLAITVLSVNGHGRLMQPAGRASLWRLPEFKHLNPPADYNDNQCFCGGVWVQYGQNGGKCGICGDPYNAPQPRDHEGGGQFAKGIITGNYSAGQDFEVQVQLTASHYGYFEFRLCPHNSPNTAATQECLDKYPLQLADGSGIQYPIKSNQAAWHTYKLRLPAGVTCSQCVLQWHYRVGNSHGYCEDGSYQLGCGDQETFRGCADISIS